MVDIDKRRMARDMAIGRFAKFVEKYFYDTDWTLVTTMCGVIDLLNEPEHERVRRAQSFRDDDYATAISSFLREVFGLDEKIGLALISEIARQEELSQKAENELAQILSIFGHENAAAASLLRSIKNPVVDTFVDVTWLPDDFYKRLVEEINRLYVNGLPMSLSILIRKLLENLIIDILRKRYGTADLSLYYDTSRRRFHDFSFLLKNLDSKKEDFRYISAELDSALIRKINRYRETGNSGAHSIDVSLTIDQISKDKDEINYLVHFLLRILQNI
jgi:hypothetical protein